MKNGVTAFLGRDSFKIFPKQTPNVTRYGECFFPVTIMTRTEFSYDSIAGDTRPIPFRNIPLQDHASSPILTSMNAEIVSMFPAHDPAGVLIDLNDTIVTAVDELTASEMNESSGGEDERAHLRNAAERIWRRCLDAIRPQLSAQTMRTWFEPLEATALEGTEITLRAPSSFFCEWIGEHYQDILEQSLRDVLGPQAKFRFDTASEVESANTKLQVPTDVAPPTMPAARPIPQPEQPRQHPVSGGFGTPIENPAFSQHGQRSGFPPASTNGQPATAKRPAIESNLNPRYTFDTFIRGESNKLAYAAAMAVANNPGGTRYNPLVIYGTVGLGKTHLIQAIGNAALQKFPSARVLYTSSDRFTVEFVDSIQNNRSNEFQALYRSVDLLIVDDVQFFAGKERTQDIFFHSFNALRELGKQIILTCDRPPKELKDIDDRLLNRLQWGLTADIAAPDLETRIAILRHKAIADGIELSGEVIEYLATNITANIRELEGCLISLLAISSLEGKEPTLELAREVLRKIAKRSAPILSIESIQRLVSRRFGIEEEALRAKTRRQEVVIARQVAMFLCKELTNHSLKSIGLHFGGRDHSTVIYAVQTIQEDMKRDPTIEKKIEELRRQLEMMQG
jgi:chromosomal replication initiator protein